MAPLYFGALWILRQRFGSSQQRFGFAAEGGKLTVSRRDVTDGHGDTLVTPFRNFQRQALFRCEKSTTITLDV